MGPEEQRMGAAGTRAEEDLLCGGSEGVCRTAVGEAVRLRDMIGVEVRDSMRRVLGCPVHRALVTVAGFGAVF